MIKLKMLGGKDEIALDERTIVQHLNQDSLQPTHIGKPLWTCRRDEIVAVDTGFEELGPVATMIVCGELP